MAVHTFIWRSGRLDVLDQRLLPGRVVYVPCRTPAEVADAIRGMAVRGAPAIGCCAAYGMALAAAEIRNSKHEIQKYLFKLRKAGDLLKASRPTAVNLAWAVDRMLAKARQVPVREWSSSLADEACRIEKEDVAANKAMGRHGAVLLRRGSVVLTHCNAGALATAGYGTALGIIRAAHERGKIRKVFVDETRPYLQGARLTAWELAQERIPHDLITDNMAGHFMKTEKISAVIVGCDRVAANGDTANKIGTYSVAVLAKHHKIPFYVAMPSSTLDLATPTGDDIPIEDRSVGEVVNVGNWRIAPKQTTARHPAFDVTPAGFIAAFVTEFGVVRPPFRDNLRVIKKKRDVLLGQA